MKSKKIPKFVERMKKDPKSKNPGKNSKAASKTAGRSNRQVQADSLRDAPDAPAVAGNTADVALAKMTKPRPSADTGY